MNKDQVFEKVKRAVVSKFMDISEDSITLHSDFVNDLKLDSLDQVELAMNFEDEFNIEISDEDAEKIQTVWQAVDYLMERMK